MITIIKSLIATFVLLLLSGCITIYQSIGHNFGAYVATVSGKEYDQVANRWDYENKALLYVYRPNSQWAADEVEAPSFYLDNERIFNIRANGYTWFELEPGEYEVIMRRPLFGLEGVATESFEFDLKRIAQMNLAVEADKVYFLRYSEIDPPNPDYQKVDEDVPLADGPLVLVSKDLAHQELVATRMLPEGGRFIQSSGPLTEDELEDVFDSRVIDLDEQAQEDENTMQWWW
ncbi:DUF2846 domain-containing protein [Bermanella sp. R86510]|uniref:DUF2846 domain-containing protein n=1 Tax=unclassified Bermanella TaxID=2627862 RepID=UPI0037C67E88